MSTFVLICIICCVFVAFAIVATVLIAILIKNQQKKENGSTIDKDSDKIKESK